MGKWSMFAVREPPEHGHVFRGKMFMFRFPFCWSSPIATHVFHMHVCVSFRDELRQVIFSSLEEF